MTISSLSIIRKAIKLSSEVHANQFRRDGKTPYFIHPKRVARLVAESGGNEQQIVLAYLHDVIENYNGDKNEIKQRIAKTFGNRMLKLVLLLTREEGANYLSYIKRIKRNHLVLPVKLCDMITNLSDKPTEKQKRNYVQALMELASR
ncbi:MAG: HD domain-containing protein [Candidatus Micrarchaeota archaeon]